MATTMSGQDHQGAERGRGSRRAQPKAICYKSHKTKSPASFCSDPMLSNRIRFESIRSDPSAKTLDSSRMSSRCYYFIIIYKMHVLYTTYESAATVVDVVVEVVWLQFKFWWGRVAQWAGARDLWRFHDWGSTGCVISRHLIAVTCCLPNEFTISHCFRQ